MTERDAAPQAPAELELTPPPEGEEWELPEWVMLAWPERRREIDHASDDGCFPETVPVRVSGEVVAVAEPFTYHLANQYCWDSEYYLVLRARELLRPEAWRALPWGHLEAGDVFVAWDRFHGHGYLRTPGGGPEMSYGGDFDDLQLLVDHDHPRAEGPRPIGRVSPASLLRAVRAGDVERVRSLLAAGADPDAGREVPDAALRSVSVDRDSTALWDAMLLDSVPLVEALLAAGASVRAPWPGAAPPLFGALVNRKVELVPVLLRFGADPDEVGPRGQTARELAASLGLGELLRAR